MPASIEEDLAARSCCCLGWNGVDDSDRSAFALHRFDQIGRRRALEREAIADLTDDPFLQRLDEVYARVPPGHFRGFQILSSELPSPSGGLPVLHDFGDDAPFLRCARREGHRVEQECFGAPGSSAITPGRKDAVTGYNTRGEMAYVLKGGTRGRHNDVGKQRVLRVNMRAALDGGDDRDAYIGYVLKDLSTFIMDLAPHAGIGDVRERRPIDTDHEVPSGTRENYYLVRSILGNSVEGVRNLGVSFCGEHERPSVVMHLHEQHALGVPGKL